MPQPPNPAQGGLDLCATPARLWTLGPRSLIHELQYFSIRNYSVESNSIIFTRRATRRGRMAEGVAWAASVASRSGIRALLQRVAEETRKGGRVRWQSCRRLAEQTSEKCTKMLANSFDFDFWRKVNGNIFVDFSVYFRQVFPGTHNAACCCSN